MEIKKYCIFIYIGQKMSQQYFGYLFCIRIKKNNTIFYAKYTIYFLFVDEILSKHKKTVKKQAQFVLYRHSISAT